MVRSSTTTTRRHRGRPRPWTGHRVCWAARQFELRTRRFGRWSTGARARPLEPACRSRRHRTGHRGRPRALRRSRLGGPLDALAEMMPVAGAHADIALRCARRSAIPAHVSIVRRDCPGRSASSTRCSSYDATAAPCVTGRGRLGDPRGRPAQRADIALLRAGALGFLVRGDRVRPGGQVEELTGA